MIKIPSSSNIQLVGISQKVGHKILYALARSVAVEQLARQKNRLPFNQKKKNGKNSSKHI
ncbi:MAG: hypothetical protein ACOYVG_08225 [Bacteroidota bacterium]